MIAEKPKPNADLAEALAVLRNEPASSPLRLHATIYLWAAGRFGDGLVVDIGAEAGIGSALLGLAGCRVIAVEREPGWKDTLRHLTEGLPVSPVAGDAVHLPLADHSSAGICLINLLHLLPDPHSALAECARVLKPGSPVIIGLPLDQNLPGKWRRTGARHRLSQLASPSFDEIAYPDGIECKGAWIGDYHFSLTETSSMLVAVCRNHSRAFNKDRTGNVKEI